MRRRSLSSSTGLLSPCCLPSPCSPHPKARVCREGTLQLPVGGGPLPTSFPAGETMSSGNTGSTPSIRVYDSHQYSLPHHPRSPFPATASPMAIPRTRQEAAPPALPPPRYLGNLHHGQDPGWQWSSTNSLADTGFAGNGLATIKPGSSLRGASISSQHSSRKASVDHIITKGFDPSTSTSMDDVSSEHSGEHNSDQDRKSTSRPSLGNHR